MNLKTTFLLLVLSGAGALLWWYGHLPLPPTLDLAPQPAAVQEKGTRDFLNSLRPDKIQRLEVRAPSGITEFTHKPDGQWILPGNWPIRRLEVENLVGLLTGLCSRFLPQPIYDDKDLQAFGLDRPPVTVTIHVEGEDHTLAFGEQQADNLENRFSRDTYVRLDKKPEVVRLAPGLISALDKPTDYYQERRLFEKETISGDDRSDTVEQLRAQSLTIEDRRQKPQGIRFTVERYGKSWKEAKLTEPVLDRLDEEALKSLLAGVLDLWAEQFVPAGSGGVSPWLWHAHAFPDAAALAVDLFFSTQGGLLVRAGLTDPERIISAKNDKGDRVTLLIGSISRSRSTLFPGMQQRAASGTEEHRYAKLQYNDQIFEIKADKLKDIFVSLDKLRDSRIANFSSSDARRVEITHGGEDIVLERDKDSWKLTKPFSAEADNSKVTDLLTKLSDLKARGEDILDKDPKEFGFDKPQAVVKITLEEESKNREGKQKKSRMLTVRVGRHDTDKKKLYVMADDWPRINLVDDGLAPLVQRSALAYRGKRLFDFNAADVAKIDINNEGKKLTLQRSHAENGNETTAWQMTEPVKADADATKIGQLLGDLGHLEAAEFVAEEPKKDELETRYGLGKPTLTVRIEFADKKKPIKEMHIGKKREGAGSYFARVADGGPVFAINEDLHKQLTRDSLSYRPQNLWQLLPEEVESLRVHKAGHKEYELTRSGSKWKISGPFEAEAAGESVQKMTAELLAPKVESYTAHEAKDLSEYGLDQPMLSVRIKPVLAKNDKQHTLLIGKPVRSRGAEHGNEGPAYYAKRGNDAAIFTVSKALVRAADRSALELLDSKLLSLEASKVGRVHFQVGDKSLTLERSLAERGNAKGGWQVTESPAGAYPTDAEAISSLNSLWSDLRAQRFVDYGKNVEWAKYGLEKPALRITLKADKTEHVIELGNKAWGESEARYARVDRGPAAAVLFPETTRLLERDYLEYVNHDLLKFDSTTVVSLQRRIGMNVLEVVRSQAGTGNEGAVWNIIQPAKEKADEKVMQQLFEQLGSLRAERIAAYPYSRSQAEHGKGTDTFGLDNPSALVTIKLKSDQKPNEHIIKLGKLADKTGKRFALVDDGKAVAVLSASLSEQLTGGPLAFRDRIVASFADADRLQLERGPRHAVFSKVEGTWKLSEPLQAEAEQDLLDDFLSRLKRLRADALVIESPDLGDLKKYGLDHPEAQWQIQSGDKEILKLLIGNKEPNGERRYAKLAASPMPSLPGVAWGGVFLLDSRLSQKVLDEYRLRTVWVPSLDAVDIESLHYRYSRSPFSLEKAGSNWQAASRPDVKINTATVEDTLAALAALKLSRYAVDKDANFALFGLDKPELVLEIGTRSGKRLLHIGNVESNSKGRYARIPDSGRSDVFVLDDQTCKRLMRDLSAFSRPPAQANVQPAAR